MWQDIDGYLFFVARNDDIISSAGYRIGPAVAEVAVIGKLDAGRNEIIKAYVVLRQGDAPGNRLVSEIQQHVRVRLSHHAYPREVEFIDELPKTPSGKIQRFVLRHRSSQ